MEKSRISRNHQCNIHTNQSIISVCLEADCYRPVLCLECINDPEIHISTHNNIISLEEFLEKVDNSQEVQKPELHDSGNFVSDLKDIAKNAKENIQVFQNNIDIEKKMIEDSINELISSFVMECHSLKQEATKRLDKQTQIFKRNYRDLNKYVKTLPSEEVKPQIMKQSSFSNFNKFLTYNQIDELIKKHQKELNVPKQAPKEVDENTLKLQAITQTMRDNAYYPCSTVLSDTNLETMKRDLSDTVGKFFDKYLKIQREVLPVDIGKCFKSDSKILNEKGLAVLHGFFLDDYKEPILELIFRGSRNGYGAQEFHDFCDARGSTVILIRATNKKVFGGYTDLSWNRDDQYQSTDKSFLFSMDFKEKFKLKSGHAQYAIKGSKELGPCFGGGHDLRLSPDFKSEECSGYIGFSYEAGGKYARDVYGDTSFFVDEIEVFKVSEGYDEEADNEPLENEEQKINDDGDEIRVKKEHAKVVSPSIAKKDSDDWEQLLLKNVDEMKDDDDDEKVKSPEKAKDVGEPSLSKLVGLKDLEVLLDWIDSKRNFTLDLLYRGSRDGFDAEAFHKKCDNQGPTVTLLRSKKFEQVFGGFTKQSWNKSNEAAKCADTFLFSVTKKKKFPISDVDNAIFRSESSGPVFGNGDIFICSRCDKINESYSNLGVGFEVADLNDSVVFFADEQYFMVDDIEVFQVIFFE